MTKQEIIKKLETLPDDMEVMLIQTNDECSYNTVETVEVRPITFGSPDIPKKEWAKVKCIVISDEI